MKLFCIADEDTVRGFRLAGVDGRVVTAPGQAAAALEEAVRQSKYGILIVTQQVAIGIRRQVDVIRLERDQPLIVEIPGPEGPLPGHKSLVQVVQEAVGLGLNDGSAAL